MPGTIQGKDDPWLFISVEGDIGCESAGVLLPEGFVGSSFEDLLRDLVSNS